MSDLSTFDCSECGAENPVVQGDYAVERGTDTVTIYEVNMHGSVELATGETLADAFRNLAEVVDDA